MYTLYTHLIYLYTIYTSTNLIWTGICRFSIWFSECLLKHLIRRKPVRRAWMCLKCPPESPFTGQRFCVETDLLKDHIEYTELGPFQCILYKFICLQYKELERHATHYYPHSQQRVR